VGFGVASTNAAVGDVVGAAVGEFVGFGVASTTAAVGDDVVGAAVGEFVGFGVASTNAAVGDVVGAAVGEFVGFGVASTNATAVGDDNVVGAAVCDFVGDCDGAFVGLFVVEQGSFTWAEPSNEYTTQGVVTAESDTSVSTCSARPVSSCG